MPIEELKTAIKRAAKKLFDSEIEPQLSRPEEKFGDYAANAALQLAKSSSKAPHEIARALADELKDLPGVARISIAGPGFINIRLEDSTLFNAATGAVQSSKPLAGQEVLVEFGDPNPFKEMHIGHLYSYIVGDAIASLLENQGADVKRLSYHGDVGRHVAMAIYGLRHMEQAEGDRDYLGAAYSYGYERFDQDPQAKTEIEKINQSVYSRDDPAINETHERGVKLSFEYFDKILNKLSISNDKRYFESQATPVGMKMVEENVGKVFIRSQGAVVYEGEKAGLHTRVFITSKNLPTYETKDLGLVKLKDRDFPEAARSIVITANEQTEYFKVMLAALKEIDTGLAKKTVHLSHGFVNLSTGKMSSRTGDVYAAGDLISEVEQAVRTAFPESEPDSQTALAALKYDFLKPRLGGNITFDVNESISLEGNSGPYIQYAHARAASILAKAKNGSAESRIQNPELDPAERSLARKISEYPEVLQKASDELMPHHICTYLYELAQGFNRFYETSRIIGDEREQLRLSLTRSYQQVLKSGLGILNIAAPNHL